MHNVTSPNTSDEAVEQEIQRKGKTAARITPADLAENISACHFLNAGTAVAAVGTTYEAVEKILQGTDGEQLLTICVLTLKNGFTVTGTSSCASPENYDREIGEKIARDNAERQIWPLMGYELKQRLHDQQRHLSNYPEDFAPHQQRVVVELGELNEKRLALDKFFATDLFDTLPDSSKGDMFEQAEVMKNYAAILQRRIEAF